MYIYNPSYNPNFLNHFLEPINTSNILLMLVDEFGNKTKINPTEIRLIHVINNIVNVTIANNKVLKLNFSTNTEAKLALKDLNTRLGLLKGRVNANAGLLDTLQVVIEHDYTDYLTTIDIDGDHTEIGFVMRKKPKPNSYIIVFINGMETELSSNGDRDSAPVYFSGDGGLTSKDFYENPVLMGDKLYWNSSYGLDGNIFGQLDAGSRISIYYLQDILVESGVTNSTSNVVIEQQYNDFTIPIDIDTTKNGVYIGLELTANPLRKSAILLFLNGQEVDIVSNGNKLSAPAYFSGDNGLTSRDFTNNYIRDGDKLYWNCALYDNYNASDRISMYYLINN